MELSVFIGMGSFIGYWVGGVFQLFWGRGGNFGDWATVHFLTFMVGLGTVMVLVGVSFSMLICYKWELLRWHSGRESACQCRRCRFNPWVSKLPWRRQWQPIPIFLPEKSHGQRSLVGYSPWGHKESDMTERLGTHFLHLSKHPSPLSYPHVSGLHHMPLP